MKKIFLKSFLDYLIISPRLFFYQLVIELDRRHKTILPTVCIDSIIKEKNDFIYNYLIKRMDLSITSKKEKNLEYKVPKIIWIMWWQGINSAPPIVKKCIDSMRKNNPSCTVIIIDKNNYFNYVHIDRAIIDAYKNGKIRIQHLSDLLRLELLFSYGGIWVDSTLFSLRAFPDSIFDFEFYTAKKTEPDINSKYWVDLNKWTSYFLVSKKGNATIGWILGNLRFFLLNSEKIPDYVLISYIAKVAREKVPELKREYDLIPKNNFYIETGKRMLLTGSFDVVQRSDTFLVKMDHRNPEVYRKLNKLIDKGELS